MREYKKKKQQKKLQKWQVHPSTVMYIVTRRGIPGPYADHYKGGFIPPKVDLLREKEIIQ